MITIIGVVTRIVTVGDEAAFVVDCVPKAEWVSCPRAALPEPFGIGLGVAVRASPRSASLPDAISTCTAAFDLGSAPSAKRAHSVCVLPAADDVQAVALARITHGASGIITAVVLAALKRIGIDHQDNAPVVLVDAAVEAARQIVQEEVARAVAAPSVIDTNQRIVARIPEIIDVALRCFVGERPQAQA